MNKLKDHHNIEISIARGNSPEEIMAISANRTFNDKQAGSIHKDYREFLAKQKGMTVIGFLPLDSVTELAVILQSHMEFQKDKTRYSKYVDQSIDVEMAISEQGNGVYIYLGLQSRQKISFTPETIEKVLKEYSVDLMAGYKMVLANNKQ